MKWKAHVKSQAKKYELEELLLLKEGKTKMKKLNYTTLKMQDYLLEHDVKTARSVFKFRTHMSDFGKNYGLDAFCPLCKGHEDSQEMTLVCPEMKNLKLFNDKSDYDKIFTNKIPSDLARAIYRMEKIRTQ